MYFPSIEFGLGMQIKEGYFKKYILSNNRDKGMGGGGFGVKKQKNN